MNGRERVERLCDQRIAARSSCGSPLELAEYTKLDSMMRELAADLDAPIRWRPIATAERVPEVKVLLLLNDGEAVTAQFVTKKHIYCWLNEKRGHLWSDANCTHWAPLTPPDSKGGGV